MSEQNQAPSARTEAERLHGSHLPADGPCPRADNGLSFLRGKKDETVTLALPSHTFLQSILSTFSLFRTNKFFEWCVRLCAYVYMELL